MLLVLAVVLAVLVLPDEWDVPVVAVAAAIEIGEAFFWMRFSQRDAVKVGPETLIGRVAEVTAPCRPTGTVRLDGELWTGRCAAGADAGQRVRVIGVEGLVLAVEPTADAMIGP